MCINYILFIYMLLGADLSIHILSGKSVLDNFNSSIMIDRLIDLFIDHILYQVAR